MNEEKKSRFQNLWFGRKRLAKCKGTMVRDRRNGLHSKKLTSSGQKWVQATEKRKNKIFLLHKIFRSFYLFFLNQIDHSYFFVDCLIKLSCFFSQMIVFRWLAEFAKYIYRLFYETLFPVLLALIFLPWADG